MKINYLLPLGDTFSTNVGFSNQYANNMFNFGGVYRNFKSSTLGYGANFFFDNQVEGRITRKSVGIEAAAPIWYTTANFYSAGTSLADFPGFDIIGGGNINMPPALSPVNHLVADFKLFRHPSWKWLF